MPDKSGGTKNIQTSFKDVETLKREERSRRRLLRIEQVRQQSKEVANLVRQKVSGEREKQIGLVQERVQARTQQWQVRKLKALQSEYESTILNVGKSHADAACLPNEDILRKIESEKTLVAAQRRGQEALNRLREEEATRRRADEERRQHIMNTRAVEEARSAAVVALPKPDSTVGIKSMPAKSLINVVPPVPGTTVAKTVSKSTIPEWPKRSWPAQTLPLGILSTESENEQGDSLQIATDTALECDAIFKNQTCMPVSSHGDTMNLIKSKNVPHNSQSVKTSQPASFMASASHSDVKLYDYTSCYQSQYDQISSFVEKVHESEKLNANEAAIKEIGAEKFSCKSSAVQREQLRSREALQRVQVQRDYKDIMGNLTILAKQNAAVCSYKDLPDGSWIQRKSQEEKLNCAIENLLQAAETSPSNSVLETPDSPDGSLIISQLGDTPGSAPRLNVGRCKLPNLATEQVEPKDDSSTTGSLVIAPPFEPHNTTITSRQENMERDLALRSLVQRINDERHSLIFSQQPVDASQTNRNQISDKTDLDVKLLEERVLLQRQQLREQRSEVKHLNDRILVPECMKQSRGQPNVSTSACSSLTHESITIDASYSDEFQDMAGSSPEVLPHKGKKSKRKVTKSGIKSVDSSPTKDKMKYSLDVSLSSVVMDQTENSSSGSKSVSLHGVQVLVKLCGAEKDSSVCSSGSFCSKEDKAVKVVELPSDTNMVGDLEKEENHTILKNVKEVKQSIKKKGKRTKEVSNRKVSKALTNVASKKDKDCLQATKKTCKSTKYVAKEEKQEADKLIGVKREADENAHETIRAEKEKPDQAESTSTSYLSPPDRVISSLTEDIKALIALAQSSIEPQLKNAHSLNKTPQIQQYINRLLAMSRESIDRLNVSCSDVSTPASAIFHFSGPENETDPNLSDIGLAAPTEKDAFKSRNINYGKDNNITDCPDSFSSDNHVIHTPGEVDELFTHSTPNDNATLTDMTKQCHERISALTRMIEEVRRETVVSSDSRHSESDRSFIPNQSRSPMHFDSTTYMSPPPQVLEWADIAFPSRSAETSGMSVDPYGTAVRQLLADVQSQMIQRATEPSLVTASLQDNRPKEQYEFLETSQNRPKPPVAFWKNIERCNVSSPTEPHELSTILELGTTLPESVESLEPGFASPLHPLSRPSTPGTPPDVVAELMRRKLLTSPFLWAKKSEKHHARSDSNSSLKNSLDSDLSSMKSGIEQSDISASKETNTMSVQSQNSSSNGSRGWKTNILMSPVDLCSSADEVEGDFRKMGIGWVGAMLRKTKEAGALSSTSGSDASPIKIDNSDFKAVSKMADDEPILSSPLLANVIQGRRHSTPVKHLADHSSSSSAV